MESAKCTENVLIENCESLCNRQLKWELLKYEVWKFAIKYTKKIAKEKRQQRTNLENQLKILKKCLGEGDNLSKYYAIKNDGK